MGNTVFNSWTQAVHLMKQKPKNCLKIIGCQIVIWLLNLIPVIFMGNPLVMLVVLLPVSIFNTLLLYTVYEKLFLSEEKSSFVEIIQYFKRQLQTKGWRLVKYFILFFVILVITFFIFGLIVIFIMNDSLINANDPYGVTLFDSWTTFSLVVMGVSLFLLINTYFIEYIKIGVYLGQSRVISHAFGQWKNILLIALVVCLMNLVPILGQIIFYVFNLIVPLKMLLDMKQLQSSEIVTN